MGMSMSVWSQGAMVIPLRTNQSDYTEQCKKVLESERQQVAADKVLLQTAYQNRELSASQKRMVSKAAAVLEGLELETNRELDVEGYVRLYQFLGKLEKDRGKKGGEVKGFKDLMGLTKPDRVQEFVNVVNAPAVMDEARASGAWSLLLGISSDEQVERKGLMMRVFMEQEKWAMAKYEGSSQIAQKSVCKELSRELEEIKKHPERALADGVAGKDKQEKLEGLLKQLKGKGKQEKS